MDLNDFLDNDYVVNDNSKELVRVDEGQLIIAQQMQEQLINFELVKKEIEKKEKEFKQKLKAVMKENGITKYESNDKKIMITLGEDSTTETVDKNKLWIEYPDVFKAVVKETPREGSLRITIRENKDE